MAGWLFHKVGKAKSPVARATSALLGRPSSRGGGAVKTMVLAGESWQMRWFVLDAEQEGTLLRVSEPNATETSRLAACIKLTKEMDGLTVLVPETNADLTNLL